MDLWNSGGSYVEPSFVNQKSGRTFLCGTYCFAEKYNVWFHKATTLVTFRNTLLLYYPFHFPIIERSLAVDAFLASETAVCLDNPVAWYTCPAFQSIN
jgi:hypothetical protein